MKLSRLVLLLRVAQMQYVKNRTELDLVLVYQIISETLTKVAGQNVPLTLIVPPIRLASEINVWTHVLELAVRTPSVTY